MKEKLFDVKFVDAAGKATHEVGVRAGNEEEAEMSARAMLAASGVRPDGSAAVREAVLPGVKT